MRRASSRLSSGPRFAACSGMPAAGQSSGASGISTMERVCCPVRLSPFYDNYLAQTLLEIAGRWLVEGQM